jgi:hypothetical protein
MAKRKDVVPVKKPNLPAPEALKASLATAKTTGDVKPVITAAKALKAAAKDAKNRQAIAEATEVVRRAERKIGQLMAEQKLTVGVNKGGAGQHKSKRDSENPVADALPTLAEAGIDKNLAYRARAAAQMDDDEFESELKEELDEILNPRKTTEQERDERRERKAYETTPEGQAALRRRKEQQEREGAEWERRDRIENPHVYERPKNEVEIIEPNGKTVVVPATVCAEVIPPKRGTRSTPSEIISPTFTAKGAVNQTRFAEAMRSVKQGLRLAYALSDRATFFKHARDMLDDLEREVVPVTAEAAAH